MFLFKLDCNCFHPVVYWIDNNTYFIIFLIDKILEQKQTPKKKVKREMSKTTFKNKAHKTIRNRSENVGTETT